MYKDEIIVPVAGSERDVLLRSFKRNIERSKEQIEKFAGGLLKDPVYEMTWADKQFMHAAQLQVDTQIVHMLEHCTDLKDITDTLNSNVMNKARYIYNTGSSTSSGYLEQCLLACRVNALDEFRHLVKLD